MIEFKVLVARGTMTEPNDANSMLDMFGLVQGQGWRVGVVGIIGRYRLMNGDVEMLGHHGQNYTFGILPDFSCPQTQTGPSAFSERMAVH